MGGERGHAPANLHREDGEWPRLEASLRHDAVVQEGHGGGGEELWAEEDDERELLRRAIIPGLRQLRPVGFSHVSFERGALMQCLSP